MAHLMEIDVLSNGFNVHYMMYIFDWTVVMCLIKMFKMSLSPNKPTNYLTQILLWYRY